MKGMYIRQINFLHLPRIDINNKDGKLTMIMLTLKENQVA